MAEQKSEEQEDKGNCLTAQRDNIFKLTKIGPAYAEETSCEVTIVPEEPMEHEAVQINCKVIRVPEELMECEVAGTNCDVTKVPQEPREHEVVQNQSLNTHLNALEFKYEPRDSCQDSGFVHLGSGECSVTEVLTESKGKFSVRTMLSDRPLRRWQLVIDHFSTEDVSQIPGGNSSKSQQWSKIKSRIMGSFRLDWELLNLDIFPSPSHNVRDIFSKFCNTLLCS